METQHLPHSRHSSPAWKRNHSASKEETHHPLVSRGSLGSTSTARPQETLVSDPSQESPADRSMKKYPSTPSPTQEAKGRRKSPWSFHMTSPDAHLVDRRQDVSSEMEGGSPMEADHRMHSSPATGWPQRSPMRPEHEEVASFALFTHSFDTLSEASHFLRPTPEKVKPVTRADTPGYPPRKIQLSETGMSDISPIKLEGAGRSKRAKKEAGTQGYPISGSNHHASSPFHGYHDNQRPHPASGAIKSGQPLYNEKGYSLIASNPFYVLRSVREAFDQCSYKLPCLYQGEICSININPYNPIQPYPKDQASQHQIEEAQRRVDTAIHAFGGYNIRPRSYIFRETSSQKNREKQQYLVTGDHLSWEVENNPTHYSSSNRSTGESGDSLNKMLQSPGVRSHASTGSIVPVDSSQKMRYRCKLCGQLKQNHNCPYQKSLQRSIAVMVHPVANAFTAAEPGRLTKPLAEMNNFVSYENSMEPQHHPSQFSPHHPAGSGRMTPHITPDTTKARWLHHSPESSLSTHSGRRNVVTSPMQRKRAAIRPSTCPYLSTDTLTLRPEHYRAVTPHKPEMEDFQYPHVPLSFHERKRLSDTLFYLSQQSLQLAEPVGSLLHLARERDEWDLAVAQLMVQMVTALYCAEGDFHLEGLRRYLLDTMGISC